MAKDRSSEVLSGLPQRRPQRRSAKRAPRAAAAAPEPAARIRQPEQPRGNPPAPDGPAPEPRAGQVPLVGLAVQAAAELTEAGLSAGARAVRGVLSRLPRP